MVMRVTCDRGDGKAHAVLPPVLPPGFRQFGSDKVGSRASGALFEAVTALLPRDDRTPERPVFQGFGSDKFRTALTRAATGAGVPVFSPHDLRHRRVSLPHLGGMPWVRIGELVGHGDIVTTARTYTHVVADEAELDYERML